MIIGITGNMGSGKSTVGAILRELNYTVLDADLICYELYQPGTTVYDFLIDLFGESIVNGDLSINRKKLANLMFSDFLKKNKLENVVHKAILEELKRKSIDYQDSIIFWEVPLLFEAGFNHEVDCVFYVTSNRDTMLSRVKVRDSLTEDKIMERLKYQKNWINQLNENDFIIVNDGSLNELKEKIALILSKIKHC